VGGQGHGGVGGVEREQLGAQFGEVDFLGVGAAVGVLFQDHGPREVLDGFFDYV